MSCTKRVRRFFGNTSGSVAVILGIVATVMVGAAGIAVDFVNASYIRTSLQHALDSAVLAASSSHVETDSEAEALIHEYMDSNWKQKFPTLAVDIKPKLGKDNITSDATTEVPTLLMGILGIKDIAIRVSSTATATESTIEVAMVIDNSSSMQSNLTLLKNSLLAVTETLDSSLSTNVEYAIIPYSVYVNVGTSNKNKSWLSFSGVDKKSWTGCVGSRDYPLELEDSGSTAIPTVTTSLCNPTELLPLTSNVSKVEDWISNLKAEVDDTYMASGLIWGVRALSERDPFDEGTPDGEAQKILISSPMDIRPWAPPTLSMRPKTLRVRPQA
jgi:Flp pilus assembly protein TadG